MTIHSAQPALSDYRSVFKDYLNNLCQGKRLSQAETEYAFRLIMEGHVPSECIAAFAVALRMQKEDLPELLGAVTAMRNAMVAVTGAPAGAMDVCGTGGDGYNTLNVSTATAFVLAALGVPVAKHGNRAVSSQTGASDVLSALGIPLLSDPAALSAQLKTHNLTFMAAPNHHPGMRFAAQARKALGIRTLFNLIGPLSNPAGVKRQMTGVFSTEWLSIIADVLATLGAEMAWAVCGMPDGEIQGIDEVTLAGPTHIVSCEQGKKNTLLLEPEMSGLISAPVSAIRGGSPGENALALTELLHGATGPYRDTVLLNAACALHVSGRVSILKNDSFDTRALREVISVVSRPLDDGSAMALLQDLRLSSSESHV